MPTLNEKKITQIIEEMAAKLRAHMQGRKREDYVVIGIHTGGVWIAERLHKLLGVSEELGELNIAFYRDDFSQIGMHPSVKPSSLSFDVDDRHIILVDDILYTGRTIRAALNEIFDYGRPSSVTLAVLVDRCEQELPVKADVVGMTMSLQPGEHVKLSGRSPLKLETQ